MQTQELTHRPPQDVLDAALVQRAQAGDQEAFEILVDRYRLPLFRLISRFLNDDQQADDVLQQVFLQLYLSLPTLRTTHTLKPWLFQVARRRCLDELRRKRPVLFSTLELDLDEEGLPAFAIIPDPNALVEELAEHHDEQHALLLAIQTLPARYRPVVLLRYVSQLSFPEIAEKLSIPKATAKTYFYRARLLLRIALTSQGYVAPL